MIASEPTTPIATEADYQRLCDFLYRRTGMTFPPAKRYFVERRLADRIAATGHAGFVGYFGHLIANRDREVERLINSFTVNETYFYREEHQFRCLTASLLGEVTARRRPGEAIRILSAPCSTGEEAYSIAIWLLENWPAVDSYDVEIVGSDIDTRALEAASEGRYGPRALMRLSPDLVDRYFDREDGDTYRLIADLRGSVRFTPVNLVDAAAMRGQGRFDVVFCRNVLIYFDDASRRVAAENIYEILAPGGYVCLGHTESMSRISPLFRPCRFAEAIVYQRPPEHRDV